MRNRSKTAKKLSASVVVVVIMMMCFAVTTYAYVFANASVNENTFQTGEIKINLNDGKPVIEAHEFLFEPGMTVVKDFFIENQSTWEVYYKIYFDNVGGELADVLEVTIEDDEKVVFEGTITELTRESVGVAEDSLKVDEVRRFTITFYFPEQEGNDRQAKDLIFKICADAVQTKNNPDKLFD